MAHAAVVGAGRSPGARRGRRGHDLYRNGSDLTKRFGALKPVINPAKSAIIDCELVACDEAGLPCFRTLMDYGKNNAPLCLWAFDLLYLNGVRITPLSLTDRKEALAELIMAADSKHLRRRGAVSPFSLKGPLVVLLEEAAVGKDERVEEAGAVLIIIASNILSRRIDPAPSRSEATRCPAGAQS